MDIICTNCGEPWESYYVYHEDPDAFEMDGVVIVHCPSCRPGKQLDSDKATLIKEIGKLYPDDPDGFAADLEDFGLV